MEHNRQIKILSIVALVIAIVGMSLGFATFSTTLNISSSATVSPNSGDFNIVFVPSNDRGTADNVYCDVTNTADCTSAKIVGTSLSGIKATFDSPDSLVYYKVDIYNSGKYDAYLTNINFGEKNCVAGDDATVSLVAAACEGISRRVSIEYYVDDIWNEISIGASQKLSDLKLSPGEKMSMSYVISYDEFAARADGNFSVEFGDLIFEYSTVNSQVSLISFNVYGVEFQAEEGMTWSNFINSSYNKNGLFSFFSLDNTNGLAGRVTYNSNTFWYMNSRPTVITDEIVADGIYGGYD